MNKKPKVSVVVPIYGVEKFLNECVDSILAQTLTDIEVILVDDGSPDKCPQIVDEYAKKDKRVVAVHQPNGGYASAVNHGVALATGEYIAIIESDDWIEPTMYEKLYNAITKYKADVSRCGFAIYNSLAEQEHERNYTWSEVTDMFRDMPDGAFCPRDHKQVFMYHSAIWTFLYKSDLIKSTPITDKARSYQDYPFMFEILAKIKKMTIVKELLHHYRMESGQGSSSTTKSKKAMQMMDMTDFTLEDLKKKKLFSGIEKEFYQHSLLANFWFYNLTPYEFQSEYATRIAKFAQSMPSEFLDDLPDYIKNWFTEVVVFSTEKKPKISPNDIHVAFSTDGNYCSSLGVALQSMINHMNSKLNYHVYILGDDVSVGDKSVIYQMDKNIKNLFIHFIDMHDYKEKIKNIFVDRHLSVAAYYRFFLPEILPDIDKVLYLDTDIIINEDIADLYNIDISKNIIGGCRDLAIVHCDFWDFKKSHEMLKSLGYKNPYDYINSGVLLFNLKKMREQNTTQKLLDTALSHSFVFHDQDAINLVCDGDIKILDGKWNFITHTSPEIYPYHVKQDIYTRIAENNIGIIHYAGASKPWNSGINSLLSGAWWKVAITSPFFNIYLSGLKYVAPVCNNTSVSTSSVRHLHRWQKLLCVHNENGHKVVRLFTLKVFSKRKK